MIIDSKKYNGMCSCRKEHKMITEFCIIEEGALKDFDKYIKDCGLSGISVAIYDENTYRATDGVHPQVNKEIILSTENLHADEKSVKQVMDGLPQNCDYLVAVGAGTVHDTTRYCASKLGIPFVACPTAASVDGFCSSVAAVTWNGFKKTFPAVAPRIVIADLGVIKKAPMRLTNSGFCDMVGKYICLADWKIAHVLTNEYFCKTIYDMTFSATKAVEESAEDIKKGSISAYEKLTYGLLMSGLAMQLLGNSRCASGAEHHISHLIEMQPEGLGVDSEALHGEKVGVGTLIATKEYHRIKDKINIEWTDYIEEEYDYIKNMFGEKLTDSVVEENENNCAKGITAAKIREKWEDIRKIIDEIPGYDILKERYDILGAKVTLSDIDVPEEKVDALMEYSPLVRNRLTFMRLRSALKEEKAMDGKRVILAAHRGDLFNYPENTMAAFESALKFGVDMIETDIRMTKDGVLVLSHDRSTLRMSGVDKNIDELTLSELRSIDVGLNHKNPIKAEVPTMREFLELIKGTGMMVNWETKVYPEEFGEEVAFGAVDKIVALIEEYDMCDKAIMCSFSAKVLEYVVKKYPGKFVIQGQGLNTCRRSYDVAKMADEDIFDWCCLWSVDGKRAVDCKENFDYCVEHKIIPCLCIPDNIDDYKQAIDWGCRMFTSNNIEEGDKILRELKVR